MLDVSMFGALFDSITRFLPPSQSRPLDHLKDTSSLQTCELPTVPPTNIPAGASSHRICTSLVDEKIGVPGGASWLGEGVG